MRSLKKSVPIDETAVPTVREADVEQGQRAWYLDPRLNRE
jgi:hypothetical protein